MDKPSDAEVRAILPYARRAVALFGIGALAIGRLLVEAIADRAIAARWPFMPVVFAGFVGIGAAAYAIFVSVTPYARKSAVPVIRWGAAAAMLFSLAVLASNQASTLNGYVAGGALLAACLCAWRAERLERIRRVHSLADV